MQGQLETLVGKKSSKFSCLGQEPGLPTVAAESGYRFYQVVQLENAHQTYTLIVCPHVQDTGCLIANIYTSISSGRQKYMTQIWFWNPNPLICLKVTSLSSTASKRKDTNHKHQKINNFEIFVLAVFWPSEPKIGPNQAKKQIQI